MAHKLLENLQKVRRSVADVTTAKKRIELQATQLQGQADTPLSPLGERQAALAGARLADPAAPPRLFSPSRVSSSTLISRNAAFS